MLEETPEQIAGRLSEAQRRALVACTDRWQNSAEIGAAGSTLTALCWLYVKGQDPISAPYVLLSRDYQDCPLRYIYRLTPLGLAVRATLTPQVPA